MRKEKAKKKKWARPMLTMLVKVDKQEEGVLTACKWNWAGSVELAVGGGYCAINGRPCPTPCAALTAS